MLPPWPAAPEPAQAQPVVQSGSRDEPMASHGSGSLVLLSDEDEDDAAAPAVGNTHAADAGSWDAGGPIADTQVRETLKLLSEMYCIMFEPLHEVGVG